MVRDHWPDKRIFTYWDYRAGMFHQDLGMRIDLALASDSGGGAGWRAAGVDREARKGTGPSDHAPVIVDLDDAPDGDIGPVVPPPSRSARPAAARSVAAAGPGAAGRGVTARLPRSQCYAVEPSDLVRRRACSVREDLGGGAGRDGAVEPEVQLRGVGAGRDPLPLLLRRGEVPGRRGASGQPRPCPRPCPR